MRESEERRIHREALIELSRFLVKAWSGVYSDVDVVIVEGAIPTTHRAFLSGREYYRVVMPPLSAIRVNDPLTQYRVWRKILWHEAMHMYFGVPDILNRDMWIRRPSWATIANAFEDYRIEELGVRVYPGMETEKRLADEVFLQRFKKELPEIVGSLRGRYSREQVRQYLVVAGFIYGLKGDITPSLSRYLGEADLERIREAVEFVKRQPLKWKMSRREYERIADEIVRILGLNEEADLVIGDGLNPGNPPDSPAITPLLNPYLSDKFDNVREDLKGKESLLEAPGEVEREFKRLLEESSKRERREKEAEKTDHKAEFKDQRLGSLSLVENRVLVPDNLYFDESPYYDSVLIQHLKDRLRVIKRRYFEVHSMSGEELEVEDYVRRSSKPFVREERVRVGGIRVLILLDFSGSIAPFQEKYKKAVIALSEALNYIGAEFAVYAFSQSPRSSLTVIWRIKGFEEKWDRMIARRLAQIRASGGTPLYAVYDLLEPIVERARPHVFITFTDGFPDLVMTTIKKIRELKRLTRMVAIAIGTDGSDPNSPLETAPQLAHRLKTLEYHRSIAVSNLSELPEKVLRLLLEPSQGF